MGEGVGEDVKIKKIKKKEEEVDIAPRNLAPDSGQLNKSGLLKYCLNSHFRVKRDP